MKGQDVKTIILLLAAVAAAMAASPSLDKIEVPPATDAITIPRMLSYQGKLTDNTGNPVIDTTYSVRFSLYTIPSGGSAFWSETQTVRTGGGLFSVLLGSVTPISTLPDAGALYLGTKVGADPEMTPRLRIVSAAYAYKSDTANYALASAGGGGDNAWVRVGGDSVLYTIRRLGIARGNANNMLNGNMAYTHVNLGVSCTTGAPGLTYAYATVGGGSDNTARGSWTTVGGGRYNLAYGGYATVAGGDRNAASGLFATVGGGFDNAALLDFATVGGGDTNTASECWTTVGGGRGNAATDTSATVGGGLANAASGYGSTVGGGRDNNARGLYATVGGGRENEVDAPWGSIAGGMDCKVFGANGFAAGFRSTVDSVHGVSAAFNGTTTTGSVQLRCGTLSKTGGSFTIDHPLDPTGTILNHYFVEGPEMLNIYRGSVVLDAGGRAEVSLPDYFSALNRSPMVQLTGVGTSDVYLAEKVNGNRFVLGGKPGTEVYWQVTGERKDVSAEAIRRMMPVEQRKTGKLAGRSLDDDFLSGCMGQLVREGKAQGIDFRTAAGRQRYEDMKRFLSEERK